LCLWKVIWFLGLYFVSVNGYVFNWKYNQSSVKDEMVLFLTVERWMNSMCKVDSYFLFWTDYCFLIGGKYFIFSKINITKTISLFIHVRNNQRSIILYTFQIMSQTNEWKYIVKV
jgi:hypothetical protein